MSSKRYYWLKLYDTFFENKTSKFIRRLPDRRQSFNCIFKTAAKIIKNRGCISL